MNNLPTPPHDIELSDSALRTLTKLSQRSSTDIILLQLLWTKVTAMLDRSTTPFVPVPVSQYNCVPKTRLPILRDTGALLTMPPDFAHLVLRKIEGCSHKLSRSDMSVERWKKVETLSGRLGSQHPDHVTNVVRLWQKVMDLKREEVQDLTMKDLGLLWQHRHAEAVLILEKLEAKVDVVRVEGSAN